MKYAISFASSLPFPSSIDEKYLKLMNMIPWQQLHRLQIGLSDGLPKLILEIGPGNSEKPAAIDQKLTQRSSRDARGREGTHGTSNKYRKFTKLLRYRYLNLPTSIFCVITSADDVGEVMFSVAFVFVYEFWIRTSSEGLAPSAAHYSVNLL